MSVQGLSEQLEELMQAQSENGLTPSQAKELKQVMDLLNAYEKVERLKKTDKPLPPPQGLDTFDDPSFVDTFDVEELAEEDRNIIAKAIAKSRKINESLERNKPCSHPAAKVTLGLRHDNINPRYVQQYPLSRQAEQIAREQVEEWLERGIIVRTSAHEPWNSPLLVAPRVDAHGQRYGWRVIIDLRKTVNAYLDDSQKEGGVPNLGHVLDFLHGCEYITELDIEDAFLTMELEERDRPATTFRFDGVAYHFTRPIWGAASVPRIFNESMIDMLNDLPGVRPYFDNIFIGMPGETLIEHAQRVSSVIDRLTKYGARVKWRKSNVGYKSLLSLGHLVNGVGMTISPAKIQKLHSWERPTTAKRLEKFLGFVTYLIHYIPNAYKLCKPWRALLKKRKGQLQKGDWNDDCERSWMWLRRSISSLPVLSYPNFEEFIIEIDASKDGVGVVLKQEYNGKCHFIGFHSKEFNIAQKRYSTPKRELFAMVFALRKYHWYLQGGPPFLIRTDSQANSRYMHVNQLDDKSQQWFSELMGYNFTIVHIPREENELADFLSNTFDKVSTVGTFTRSAARKRREAELKQTSERKKKRKTPEKPSDKVMSDENQQGAIPTIVEEVSSKIMPMEVDAVDMDATEPDATPIFTLEHKLRYPNRQIRRIIVNEMDKVVPTLEEQERLMNDWHEIAHTGALGLYQTLWTNGYYWPLMRKVCAEYVAKCPQCMQYDVKRQGFHPAKSIEARFPGDHWAADCAGPFTSTVEGYTHILVMVDVATRFLVLRALKGLTAHEVGAALYDLFAHYGAPAIVQTDNGTEFNNTLAEELMNRFTVPVEHANTLPRNPQANGLAEVYVREVKRALVKRLAGAPEFHKVLSSIQYALNLRWNPRTASSPMELFLGKPVRELRNINVNKESRLLVPDQLVKRIEELTTLIHPAIFDTSAKHAAIMRQRRNKRRKLVQPFPVGALVTYTNESRTAKGHPRQLGPAAIVRMKFTKSGTPAYTLMHEGKLLNQTYPQHKLTLVETPSGTSHEDVQPLYVVQAITDHRKTTNGEYEYQVKWLGYDKPTWEPTTSFVDQSLLAEYWKNNHTGIDGHSGPSS